jgi:hypothetical protein
VTAEFVVKQAAYQLASHIKDMEALVQQLQTGLFAQVMSGAVKPMPSVQAGPSDQSENQLFAIKEAITRALLGPEYRQMINERNNEWISNQFVLETFH